MSIRLLPSSKMSGFPPLLEGTTHPHPFDGQDPGGQPHQGPPHCSACAVFLEATLWKPSTCCPILPLPWGLDQKDFPVTRTRISTKQASPQWQAAAGGQTSQRFQIQLPIPLHGDTSCKAGPPLSSPFQMNKEEILGEYLFCTTLSTLPPRSWYRCFHHRTKGTLGYRLHWRCQFSARNPPPLSSPRRLERFVCTCLANCSPSLNSMPSACSMPGTPPADTPEGLPPPWYPDTSSLASGLLH